MTQFSEPTRSLIEPDIPGGSRRDATARSRVPLVVDLDGTLLRSDLLVEAIVAAIRRHPWGVLKLGRRLAESKARFKDELTRLAPLPSAAADQPYNDAVLAMIREARASGRPVYLASASPRPWVEAIAAHLGLFDGVFATDRRVNLKGERKADTLVAAFGHGGFDYIGDCDSDIPVWRRAREAFAVRAGKRSLERLASSTCRVLEDAAPHWHEYWRAMRPQHWIKNLLLLLPLLSSHSFSLSAFVAVFIGIFSFSCAASAAYLVNDLFDIADDRAHPMKRKRPFAAGTIPLSHGVWATPFLLILAYVSALMISQTFVALITLYIVLTFFYTFLLKTKPLIDVLTLGGLYTLRVIAGTVAIGVGVSPWLFAFCLSLFMCLAIVKRLTEIAKLPKEVDQKIRGYFREDAVVLAGLGTASGFGAVLVFALYINSDNVRMLYSTPDLLWGVCVCLLYWTSRIILLSYRGATSDDPIVWSLTNPVSVGTILSAFALVVLAAYV